MSMQLIGALRSFFRPRVTQAANTIITSLVPLSNGRKTKLTTLKYTAGVTAHTLTLLRPLGSKQELKAAFPTANGIPAGGGKSANCFTTAAAAAGATSLVLNRDPGAYAANFVTDFGASPAPVPLAADNLIASGDFLVVQLGYPSGYYLAAVSAASTNAVTGYVTVTVTAVPTGGVPQYAEVYFLGTTTDVDPRTGEAHPAYTGTASVTTTIDGNGGSIGETVGRDEPLVVHSNNATNAGVLELLTGVYSDDR